MRTTPVLAICLLCLLSQSLAQSRKPAQKSSAIKKSVTVKTARGLTIQGQFLGATPEFVRVKNGPDVHAIKLDDVLSITFDRPRGDATARESELIAEAETTDYTAAVRRMKRERQEGADVIDLRITYKPYTEGLASLRGKLIKGGWAPSEAETVITVTYSGIDLKGRITWVSARFYDANGTGDTKASLPTNNEPGAEAWQREIDSLFYAVMRLHRLNADK